MAGEISGGIKNALERGDSIEKAKQSFLNAGFSLKDIEQAIQEINPTVQLPQAAPQFRQLPQLPQISESKSYFSAYLILGVISILILIGSALAALYWDKIILWIK